MGIEETSQVRLRRAATGRRRDARELGVDDVVRLEIRLPAAVAAALFDHAHDPTSRSAASRPGSWAALSMSPWSRP
jgi:hypothetical protein